MTIDGFNYKARTRVEVHNWSTTPINQQATAIELSVAYAAFSFNPANVRFTAADGTTVIPHYYEGTGMACYRFWIRRPIPRQSQITVWCYFDPDGTPPDTSSGEHVFHFFHDFSDRILWKYQNIRWRLFGAVSDSDFGSGADGKGITISGAGTGICLGMWQDERQVDLPTVQTRLTAPDSSYLWYAPDTISFENAQFIAEAEVTNSAGSSTMYGGCLLIATNSFINGSNSATHDWGTAGFDDDAAKWSGAVSPWAGHGNSCLMMMKDYNNADKISAWTAVTGGAGYQHYSAVTNSSYIGSPVIYRARHQSALHPGHPQPHRHYARYDIFSPLTMFMPAGSLLATADHTQAAVSTWHDEGLSFLSLGFFAARYNPTYVARDTTYRWVRVRKQEVMGSSLSGSDMIAQHILPIGEPLVNLVSPADNATIDPGTVEFRFTIPSGWFSFKMLGGYTYRLQITDDGQVFASVPVTNPNPANNVVTQIVDGLVPGRNYEWHVQILHGGSVHAESEAFSFTTTSSGFFPDVIISNGQTGTAEKTSSLNTKNWVYRLRVAGAYINTIPAGAAWNIGALTDNTLLVGLQNPTAEHLPIGTAGGRANFPENVAITVSTLLQSPGMPAEQPLEDCAYSIQESNNILWWPVVSNAEASASDFDVTNLGTDRYKLWATKIYSMFSVKLIPYAINKVDIVYYNLQPGDYLYGDADSHGYVIFDRRTLYIAYYPGIKTAATDTYYEDQFAPVLIPAEGKSSGDILQLLTPTPEVQVSPLEGPGLVSQYRIARASITNPTQYETPMPVDWTDVDRVQGRQQINLVPYLKPNKYVYIEARLMHMTLYNDTYCFKPANTSRVSRYLYAAPPVGSMVYDYSQLCRIIDDPAEATMTVYKQADMEKVRYYIWDLSGQATQPGSYLNMTTTGPFDSVYKELGENIPEVVVGTYDPEGVMDTVTFVHESIPENALIGWAAKPINAANELLSHNEGPWSLNKFSCSMNFMFYTTTPSTYSQPTITGPVGTITTLLPFLEFVGKGGAVYSFWLYKKVGGNWEAVTEVSGAIALSGTGDQLISQAWLPDGFMLSNFTEYLLVLYDPGDDTRVCSIPSFVTFTTNLPAYTTYSKLADVDPLIVNRDESNIRRFAIGINSMELSTATRLSNSIAVTKPIGLPRATTALSIEAGAYFPPDADPSAIVCELQFNGTGPWTRVTPVGWPTVDAPGTIFIDQGYDSATVSKIEAEYGTGSVVQLSDIAYSIRLRFTLSNPQAKLQKFITIRGIS